MLFIVHVSVCQQVLFTVWENLAESRLNKVWRDKSILQPTQNCTVYAMPLNGSGMSVRVNHLLNWNGSVDAGAASTTSVGLSF